MANQNAKPKALPALLVRQWLPGWNQVDFNAKEHRARPEPHFYLFSLPARELRSLSGISRRHASSANSRTEDLGIQRQHDPDRSEEIKRYVEFGYPWSTLSEAKRRSTEYNDLRKPGWLPTAVILNILGPDQSRPTGAVHKDDAVSVTSGERPEVVLPYTEWKPDWQPTAAPPFEIIDGQHRLWAFDRQGGFENYDLPVVAFYNLDVSWQAYLFWTVNIKPKRINPSLAFDLYPLLRAEDWLDRAEGHAIYRETRAQELVEVLWSHPSSPWYDRINMLGETKTPWVSQSAWIKSLIATMVRAWDARGSLGGLFGSRMKANEDVLGWSRAQQAAFLIYVWEQFRLAVKGQTSEWAASLRVSGGDKLARPSNSDAAFYGVHTLINSDQGVRGFLHVVNDLLFARAVQLKLDKWVPSEESHAQALDGVSLALKNIADQPFAGFVSGIADRLATFDWRTSSYPRLDETLRREKLVFRGSSGYKELRSQLLEHLALGEDDVAQAASDLLRVS